MMFNKPVAVLILSVLSLAVAEDCLWNSTHCSCTETPIGGACFRKIAGVSPARCNVDSCAAGGHKCDCLGKDICKIDTCSTWRGVVDGAPAPAVGTMDVPCKLVSGPTCLAKIEKPVEYKMVQIGQHSEETMFNMTWQKDVDDYLVTKYQNGGSSHDSWPDRASLKLRQLNFRLYESNDGSNRFACVIINSWGAGNDGLGNYLAKFVFESLAGQQLQFLQCDDMSECRAPKTGPTLTSKHHGVVTHTDGACVSLPSDGSAVSIKTTNVQKIEGINFLGSDGNTAEYMYMDGDAGLSGSVDDNGLVTNGMVPEIIIHPAGILVQY